MLALTAISGPLAASFHQALQRSGKSVIGVMTAVATLHRVVGARTVGDQEIVAAVGVTVAVAVGAVTAARARTRTKALLSRNTNVRAVHHEEVTAVAVAVEARAEARARVGVKAEVQAGMAGMGACVVWFWSSISQPFGFFFLVFCLIFLVGIVDAAQAEAILLLVAKTDCLLSLMSYRIVVHQ
jgi:hypothetical protein